MEQDILKRLDEQAAKIDAVYRSTERTRKYILWTMIGSIVVLVLPLIGLIVAIPAYLSVLDSVASF